MEPKTPSQLSSMAAWRALKRLRALHIEDYKRLYREEGLALGVRVGQIGRPKA